MSQHTIEEASGRLQELIERALAGEGVVITRDGKAVVEIKAVAEENPAPRPITPEEIEWLWARRVPVKSPALDAGELVSRMRDEDWQ